MHFRPIIERRERVDLARALGIPAKNVRSWWANDSIPAGWFKRVAATGLATEEELLDAAERATRSKEPPHNGAAA